MSQTNVNIRMDEGLKLNFECLCGELGLNMTSAFNVFARAAVRQQGIPFEVTLDTPNRETLAAINDVNQGRNMSKPFASVKALMEDLDADD